MKIKLKKSIGFKMAIAMAVGLFVVISLFSHTNVRVSEKRLLNMAEKEASKMSNAIKSSLENAMLGNEDNGVQAIIDAIGQESMVYDIKIIDIDGKITNAKNPTAIGEHMDQTEKSCAFCHSGPEVFKENLTVMFSLEDGSQILRNVNPINNEERCYSCHEEESKILGKLLVDFTTTDIAQIVVDNRKLLILSAVATLLTSVLMCFLLSTVLVKKPLSELLVKMKDADNGADQESEIIGEDEVAVLNETYDSLMDTIEDRNQKIKQQMDELMALFNISEILNKSASIDENVDLILKALNIGFHVEECAILLMEGTSSFQTKGSLGMDEAKTIALTSCLALPGQLELVEVGRNFIAVDSDSGLSEFLVVPLKSANNIIGVITVHSVTDTEITNNELLKSFAIIATSLAPHFLIGLAQSEKQEMEVSPFNSFIDSVEKEIAKVKEYMGSLSLALIQVSNYQELCQEKGTQEASAATQDIGVQVSANLSAVHECTRISEDTVVVILPMLDAFEAPETINSATDMISSEAQLKVSVATFPDNGDNALDLLKALRG